jgi:outer membrane receptor protein involved in Fe transport
MRMSRERIALALGLFILATISLAQTNGDISGRVTDTSGAPLPGATVQTTSPSLQGTRTTTSGPDSLYRIPAVPPGQYRVTASLAGFRTVEKAATVRLDSTASADFALEPAAAEEVSVSGNASVIDTTSTTTGTNYTSQVIAQLPVNRNYADIVRSNPGVSTDKGVTEGRSLALTIYGATSAENQWIIDGVNTTNVLSGVQGKAINNEFVQEVEVKTGGYSVEYGRALGGVINVITKSGGNAFHGDGFFYYDSTGTAAEKQFKPGDSGIAQMRVVDGHRLDYGVDLGGFLLEDRLWFFGAYDRISLNSEVSRVQASTYVSTEDRFPLDVADNLYSGKLTWNAAASTSVVGTVFADPSNSSGAAGADPRQGLGAGDVNPPVSLNPSTWYSSRAQGGTDYGVRVTQLFGPRAIATIQGSYHKDGNALTAPDGIRYTDYTCAGGTPDHPCDFPPEPNNIVGGYGLVGAGPASSHDGSSRKQIGTGAMFYVGSHEIKVGGDYMDGQTQRTRFYTGQQQVFIFNEYGQLYYEHLFFGTNPDDPVVIPTYNPGARVLDYGVYLQDSWKAAPNLTVNLGLRWDGEETRTVAGETVLRFTNGWQPRVGVVWDPWSNGATKVYAFAGRFSYALPTSAVSIYFGNFPGRLFTYNFDPVSVVQDPNVINHGEALARPPAPFGDLVDAGVKASSQEEVTAGVERLFGSALTVGLKGTYRSLDSTLEDRCDFEDAPCVLVNPGSDAKYASGNAPTCNGINHQCSPTGPATPEAKRYYRGIELLARESIGTILWLQASYIYSSLRGNYDGGVNEGVYGQTSPGVNTDFDYPALWHDGYGTLALDRTNRFRFDGYWVTPWRLSVAMQAFAETGAPLNQMGFFNGAYGPLVFLVPRGSAGRLPTLWGTNLMLSYPIAIDSATVTLQASLFNVFNKQIAVDTDQSWTISPPAGYPANIYDPNQPQNNPYYGSVSRRSDPRLFRAAVKVAF